MIVCHCNTLTDAVIRQAVDQLLDEDPHRMMTPNLVYRRLGQRGRCCGCFPNVVETIIRVTEAYHARSEASGVDVVSHLDRVRKLRSELGSRTHEGRQDSHRAA